MTDLGELPRRAARDAGRWRAALVGDSNSHHLVGDVAMAAYRLDEKPPWASDEKVCDALLVVQEPALAAFVEFKGRVDEDRAAKALAQLEAAIAHFARTADARAHGAQHHAKWSRGEDLPSFTDGRNERAFTLAPGHKVLAVVMGSGVGASGGSRAWPPRTLTVAARSILVVFANTQGSSEESPMELDRFLAAIGVAPTTAPAARSERPAKRKKKQ